LQPSRWFVIDPIPESLAVRLVITEQVLAASLELDSVNAAIEKEIEQMGSK